MWVKKRQTCLLIFFEFTAARANAAEMQPPVKLAFIGRKEKQRRCETFRHKYRFKYFLDILPIYVYLSHTSHVHS